MKVKCLNNAVQFFIRPTLNTLHNLKNEAMFKVLLLTVCLMAGTFQTTYAQINNSHEPKSTATAVKYSAYGTAIPIVVGGAIILAAPEGDIGLGVSGIMVGALGAVIGPGLGHAYAGDWWHLALGSLLRSLGAIFITRGILGDDPSGMDWGESNEGSEKDEGSVALVCIGGAIYLWSAIHDFCTLDSSVEQYNQKHTGITISVSPTYYAQQNTLGIAVRVSF